MRRHGILIGALGLFCIAAPAAGQEPGPRRRLSSRRGHRRLARHSSSVRRPRDARGRRRPAARARDRRLPASGGGDQWPDLADPPAVSGQGDRRPVTAGPRRVADVGPGLHDGPGAAPGPATRRARSRSTRGPSPSRPGATRSPTSPAFARSSSMAAPRPAPRSTTRAGRTWRSCDGSR